MKPSLNILLIEDDSIEIMKLNRAIASLKLEHHVTEAGNGEEALELLNTNTYLPDIILVDLNMPKINGIEFLRILKNNDVLKYIPAIILTTSNNRTDIKECFKIGIAGYIVKPLKYEEYLSKIKKVLEYWSINELMKN